MKRLLLVVVVLASVAGCFPVRMVKWEASKKMGVVSAGLCGVCSEPYDSQMQQAHAEARAKCHGSYSVLEEGVSTNGSITYAAPVGPGFMVGTSDTHGYYWIFRCDDAVTAEPSPPAAKAPASSATAGAAEL